jgi:mannose-6-phosphate isomerase
MDAISLYPLRFEPLYQYRSWGGRRLGHLLSAPLPGSEPIGEAWLLSDRDDHASRVADGALKGKTIAELAAQSPDELLGNVGGRFERFPLLLKLLDVNEPMSVQVHPSDAYASLMPIGESGKTEAWVILENGPGARIFAGLKRAITAEGMRHAIAAGTVAQELAEFLPTPGDAVLICAGTIHSLADVVVLEIQQNSDVTFRLYDWDHIDPKTGQRRPLQVDRALACMDFEQRAVTPLTPRVIERWPVLREQLIQCDQFAATRISGRIPFIVGKAETPRVLACLVGNGYLEYAGHAHPFSRGEVLLLPAVVGACLFRPHDMVSMLEISLPEHP